MRGVRGPRGRYGAAVAVLAGATAGIVVVVLVGGSSSSPDTSGASAVSSAAHPTDPAPGAVPSVLPAVSAPAGQPPTSAGISSALAGPLRAPLLGPSVSTVVFDGGGSAASPAGTAGSTEGAVLYGSGQTTPVAPASTAKLVTAVSALHFVGGDATLDTRTVAGAISSEIVLVGAGDPTITKTARGRYPRTASLDALARQSAAALSPSVRGSVRLVLDDSLFTGPVTGPGWDPADLSSGLVSRVSALSLDEARVKPGQLTRYPDPTAAMGRAFTAALSAHGVTVAATTRGVAAAGATELGSVSSPPVSALVEQMLLTSDNDLAEALAHLAGVAAGTGGSFVGGSAASGQALSWLGVDATGATLVDGSGISRDNRLTASTLGSLLVASARADRPELAAVLTGLPVAGVSGSLADRFDTARTDDARGRVRAKTGTLTGVNGLAGTVLDREGRTLVLVVLADRTSSDTLAVRAALDRVAAALESCGCR